MEKEQAVVDYETGYNPLPSLGLYFLSLSFSSCSARLDIRESSLSTLGFETVYRYIIPYIVRYCWKWQANGMVVDTQGK